jgi:hypothetical protein
MKGKSKLRCIIVTKIAGGPGPAVGFVECVARHHVKLGLGRLLREARTIRKCYLPIAPFATSF